MKDRVKYLLIFILMMVLIPINVKASDAVTLRANKDVLEVGDELVVKASFPKDKKLYAVIATLKFDENVFEKIDDTNFDVNNDTIDVTYNEYNNKFGIINKSGDTSNNLFTVHLKVKDKANVGNTNIALTNISSSDGSKMINYPTTSIKLMVTRDAVDDEALPNNSENKIEEDNENIIKTITVIPFMTGLLSVAGILLLAILYVKFKYNNKKQFYLLMICEIAVLVIVGILLGVHNQKKDVNDDGVKDYQDAKEIIEYLINVGREQDDNTLNNNEDNDTNNDKVGNQNESVKKPSNTKKPTNNKKPTTNKDDNFSHDVDGDGKVDVDDAGHITEQVTENSKVILNEIKEDNNYVKKGEVTLSFEATITPKDAKIVKVKVDGKYYAVEFNNGIYSVTIDSPTKSGKYEFVITDVLLSNQKEVSSKLVFKKEVLKDIPAVNMFNLNDEAKTLSFKLHDLEDALIEGTIYIYDENNNKLMSEVLKSDNTIHYEFLEDKIYNIVVLATYDLDSDKTNKDNLYVEQEIFSHTFTLGGNYDFVLTDVGITDAIQKNEKPIVSFKSSNVKNVPIERATLTMKDNTNEYMITKVTGDLYEVELTDALTTPGKHTVTLDSVALRTLRTFLNEKDYHANTLTYNVLKTKPVVTNIELQDIKDTKSIKVNFKIQDGDNTLKGLKAVLVDSTGKIVVSKDIDDLVNNKEQEILLAYDKNTDGHYKVEFLGSYELGDKYTYTDTSIGEEEITIVNDIYIKRIEIKTPNTKYPTKGQKRYELSFYVYVGDSVQNDFKTNYNIGSNYTRLSAITINGLNYVAEQEKTDEANTYRSRVTLTVPDEAGILDIMANRVQLEYTSYYTKIHNFYTVLDNKITIDVLKDEPKIANLIINDDYLKGEVTFDFDVLLDKKAQDNDDSFKEGKIRLGDKEQEIKRGHNTITFLDVKKDENMDFSILASYDLDSDILEEAKDQNEYSNKEIFKAKYGLFSDSTYEDITINKGVALSKDNNKYFLKNEDVKLNFEIAGIKEELGVEPQKVIIDNKEYLLTKIEDKYQVMLNGYSSCGEKEVVITDIILNNGKKITLKEETKIKLEILKDVITISNFKYEILDNKQIKLTLEATDTDKSLVGNARVLIVDDKGQEKYNGSYQKEIRFVSLDNVLRYYVKVYVDYDRDIDMIEGSPNYYESAILLDEVISLDENNIELKDITDVSLYKVTEENGLEKVLLVDEINVQELKNNKDDYFVEVVMDSMPSVRAKIKMVVEENKHLFIVLDYQYVTKENTNKTRTIRIDFGEIKEGIVRNEFHPDKALKELLEKLNNNENVTLMRDYDASLINTDSEYYVLSYSGILDGNGHKIYNLDKQLFKELGANAEIKNLTIDKAKISGAVRGILANTATDVKIDNVHIYNSSIKANEVTDGTGIMFGDTKNSIIIEASSIVNSMASGGKRIGGFIGRSYNNVIVRNSYINNSTIAGSWDAIGGIVGEVDKATIENCYSKVELTTSSGTKAGFLGWTNNVNNTYLNNSVSFADGTGGYRVHGNGIKANNVYELEESKLASNQNSSINVISKKEINASFFKNTLHWDDSIWNLDGVSFDNPPIFKGEDFEVKSPYSDMQGYDSNKEILYENLTKLMPFYDKDKIINTAKYINDDYLDNKEISHIVPVDKTGGIVTYLTSDNVKKISKIKIVFKTKEKIEYDVRFDNTYDMVASYRIDKLGIDYNYNHYVIDANSQVVNNLTNYLSSLDYTNNLDILTSMDDSRIYRDFYNEVTSKELKEFVLKFLANSNYTNTTNNDGINSYIEREIKKDKKIEKVLYMYNYLRRFYDIDIDGMKLYDFVLFNMQGFDNSLTPLRITDLFFKDSNNFKTNETNTRYASVLGEYTNLKTIAKFLEYVVTEFSDKDMDIWTKEQFKGYLVEIPIKDHPEVQYTLWDHFSNEDANHKGNSYKPYNFILPILTLPKNAAYIISSPVQFIIGSERTYMVDPENPDEQVKFKRRVESYTTRMASYYDTAYKLLNDAQVFNDIHTFQTDKRYTYDINGSSTYQQPYTTSDPFHKNFNEVVGQWAYSDGNAAVAWGDRIDWSAEGLMDGNLIPEYGEVQEYTYHTWSHESAHNIDARLFLRNNGRRFDAGGEDYADSNLMQSFGPNDIVMNLSVYFDKDTQIGSNYTPERIDTPAEIYDYYNKVFKTIYVMDYIEAMAFLQLDPDDQANTAVQVSYPNEEKYGGSEYSKFRARQTTRYSYLDTKAFQDMHLSSIDDLINNRLMLYPGVYKVASRGSNSYGGEGLNSVHWYQPNNPDGRPDSYALKWIAYEMLGYAGYEKGYIEYNSNINYIRKEIYNNIDDPSKGVSYANYKTDTMALKTITEGKFEDFDTYKKYRFQETKDNLAKLNKVVNVKDYVQRFYDALIKDAEHYRTDVGKLLERKPTCISDYWCNRLELAPLLGLTESNQVRRDLYYALKKETDDFLDDIFLDTPQQDVSDLKVNKG